MIEIWKSIDGYEGLYEVSNTGKIKTLNYTSEPSIGFEPMTDCLQNNC